MEEPGGGTEVAKGSFIMGVGADVLLFGPPAPRLPRQHRTAWACVDAAARHYPGDLPSEVRGRERERKKGAARWEEVRGRERDNLVER